MSSKGGTGWRSFRGGPLLPALPAAGRVARGLRGGPAAPLSRRGVLGEAARRLRRPGGAAADRRPRPGGARRQPDRAHVHRRPLRRVALRGAAPRRLRQPGPRPSTAATGCGCATPRSPPSSAARRRPTSRRRPSATTASPTSSGSWRCSSAAASIVALGAFAWDGALRAARALGAEVPRPQAALRPRRRGRPRPLARCSAASTRASRTPSPAS